MVSRISPMPNRPMTAIRKSKPVSSSVKPKVRRSWPVTLIEADGGEREADHHRGDGFERRLLAHADERAEGEEIHGELFRRPELQRELRDQRRNQRDHDDGEQRADERRRERGGERLAGLALLRHRMAVERGRDRPRLARNVEQDRGDRAAEQRAPVDAGQHDDRRGRRHAEGERQQDRDAVGAAEPGQHADDHAEQDADHHQQQVERLDHDREAVKQIGDFFHRACLSPSPTAMPLEVRQLQPEAILDRSLRQRHQEPFLEHQIGRRRRRRSHGRRSIACCSGRATS